MEKEENSGKKLATRKCQICHSENETTFCPVLMMFPENFPDTVCGPCLESSAFAHAKYVFTGLLFVPPIMKVLSISNWHMIEPKVETYSISGHFLPAIASILMCGFDGYMVECSCHNDKVVDKDIIPAVHPALNQSKYFRGMCSKCSGGIIALPPSRVDGQDPRSVDDLKDLMEREFLRQKFGDPPVEIPA